MATYADVIAQLKTRRDAICTELAALTETAAGGKPNSQLGGIDHVGYKDGLYRELREIEELIAKYTWLDETGGGGPIEVETIGES